MPKKRKMIIQEAEVEVPSPAVEGVGVADQVIASNNIADTQVQLQVIISDTQESISATEEPPTAEVAEEPAMVKVKVLAGSLVIEWPIGAQPVKFCKSFSQGDIVEMPRERAIKIGKDVQIL